MSPVRRRLAMRGLARSMSRGAPRSPRRRSCSAGSLPGTALSRCRAERTFRPRRSRRDSPGPGRSTKTAARPRPTTSSWAPFLGAVGRYDLSAGTLDVTGVFAVGVGGGGTFEQLGGTATIGTLQVGVWNGGSSSDGTDSVLVTGASMLEATEIVLGGESESTPEGGVISQLNGDVSTARLQMTDISRYDLIGGSLTLTGPTQGGSFEYNGGSLALPPFEAFSPDVFTLAPDPIGNVTLVVDPSVSLLSFETLELGRFGQGKLVLTDTFGGGGLASAGDVLLGVEAARSASSRSRRARSTSRVRSWEVRVRARSACSRTSPCGGLPDVDVRNLVVNGNLLTTIDAGQIFQTGNVFVGTDGNARIIQSGGSHTVDEQLYLGTSSDNGTYRTTLLVLHACTLSGFSLQIFSQSTLFRRPLASVSTPPLPLKFASPPSLRMQMPLNHRGLSRLNSSFPPSSFTAQQPDETATQPLLCLSRGLIEFIRWRWLGAESEARVYKLSLCKSGGEKSGGGGGPLKGLLLRRWVVLLRVYSSLGS